MSAIDWEFMDRLADSVVQSAREQVPDLTLEQQTAMHELQAIYQALIEVQVPDTYEILTRLVRLQENATLAGYKTGWKEATSW
jgi:hypothetical protein